MPTSSEAIDAPHRPTRRQTGSRGRCLPAGRLERWIPRHGGLAAGHESVFRPSRASTGSGTRRPSALGMRRAEQMDGDPSQARIGLQRAATALESVIAKGDRQEADRHFHFVMAAASLSSRPPIGSCVFAAHRHCGGAELLPHRAALALLMRRDITALAGPESTHSGLNGAVRTRDRGPHSRTAWSAWRGRRPDRDGHDFLFEGFDLALTDLFSPPSRCSCLRWTAESARLSIEPSPTSAKTWLLHRVEPSASMVGSSGRNPPALRSLGEYLP